MMKNYSVVILLTLTLTKVYAQKDSSLALTPPMGWNSWNSFGLNIDEELIKKTADAIVDLGLLEAGFEYLVLDDGWMAMERDANGKLYGDTIRFPSGMKALGDYIHSNGLKYGIYNCAGYQTCGGYPGSRGFEYIDAQTYAEWGVDYLKYDWCNTDKLNAEGAYMTMRDALAAAGRPIVFSICEWGKNEPWKWGEDVGHLWRVTGDIINCWDCEVGHGSWTSLGIWSIINLQKDIRQYSGPGHWNDYDMMEVGNALTDAENRSHFAMWCMLASPLIMGNDVLSIDSETLKTLTNKEVVAINQDALGIQGFRFSNEHNIEIWIKPLSNEEWAVSFVNMKDEKVTFNFDWYKHDMFDEANKRRIDVKKRAYKIRDLFNHKELGNTSKSLNVKLDSHDVLLLRLNL